jgi:hypothetical protein
MANIAAIRSVGSSLAEYLNNSYRAAVFPPGINKPGCTFSIVSSGSMQTQDEPSNQAVQVLLYLYRTNIDAHLRNAGRAATPDMRPVPLSVDLHFLFTFWSTSAESEHLALAWTMRQLHLTPLLDGTILSTDAAWNADEIVHLIPSELSNEDTMRIWDALRPDYHLSLAYIARVVRIDPDVIDEAGPVVATRLRYAAPAAPS